MSRLRLIVAVNPNSAFGRHGGLGLRVADVLEQAGHDPVVFMAPTLVELEVRVREALDGADALVVVGGDGMVSLGVNVLAESAIPLGIVAAGTGNDFARGVGISHDDPEKSLAELCAVLEGVPRQIDAVRIERTDGTLVRWYVGVFSAGFDALVNERANHMRWPKGPARYVRALFVEILRLRSRHYTLTIDGVTRHVNAVLVAVANNSWFGGGMHVAPQAQLDDGTLDVFIGHSLSRRALLRVFPRVFKGTHVTHPAVEFVRAREVSVDSTAIVAYADGERVQHLPLRLRVVPGALRVFVR